MTVARGILWRCCHRMIKAFVCSMVLSFPGNAIWTILIYIFLINSMR